MNPFQPLSKSTVSNWSFLLVPSAALLFMLWLPFGFGIGGLIEEWDVLSLFVRNGTFFWAGGDSPLALHRLRPLTVAPHAIAYTLDHNSFYFWHCLLLASLMLKGVVVGTLTWWLTRSRRWSALFGVLIIVYPADTMQLSFRSLHIDWAVSVGLLAIAACTCSFVAEVRRLRYFASSVAALSLITATFAYEAILLLAPAPVLFLYARFGFRHSLAILSRSKVALICWCGVTAFSAAYIIYALKSGTTYQGAGVAASVDGSLALLRSKQLISTGFGRSLFGGWIDAVAIVFYEYQSYWYLLSAAAFVLFATHHAQRTSTLVEEPRLPVPGLPHRLAIIGLIMLGLGYLPFLLSPAHIAISQRTFLVASVGAVFALLGLMLVLARFAAKATAVLAAVLVTVGLAQQMYQFHHYQSVSDQQREILAKIVENVPAIPDGRRLLILDESERINNVWMLRDNLVQALTYLYDKPIDSAYVCSKSSSIWQRMDEQRRAGRCLETKDEWVFRRGLAVSGPGFPAADSSKDIVERWPKSDFIVVVLHRDGTASTSFPSAAHRQILEHGTDPLSLRYRNVLRPGPWPFSVDQFRHDQPGRTFAWDFGRWWSMEMSTVGGGWRDNEWELDGLEHVSSSWKTQPVSNLLFDMAPSDGAYELQGKILAFAPKNLAKDVKISLNSVELPVKWIDEQRFEVAVPARVLVRGHNDLQFESPVARDFYGLSFKMDWIKLFPTDRKG